MSMKGAEKVAYKKYSPNQARWEKKVNKNIMNRIEGRSVPKEMIS